MPTATASTPTDSGTPAADTAATVPVAGTPPGTAPPAASATAPATIERKALDFAVKAMSAADDSGPGTATLYVAAFGNRDRSGEVITPNAFRNLDAFVKDGFYTVSHNWGILPVATITSAVQDGTGLRLDIEFHSTPEAQSCRTVMRERMERGKAVKSSIGYQVVEDTKEADDGELTRYLKSIDIYEASFVPVPCNPRADAVAIKGMNMGAIEMKYFDSSMFGGPINPEIAVSADAASNAIYALHSALIRGVGRAICDTDRPKAERLADLNAAFAAFAAKSLRVIDALMDADPAVTETAAKAFDDLATKGFALAPLDTKAGRPISRANHAAMAGHVAAGMEGCNLAIKAMGEMTTFLKAFDPAGMGDDDSDADGMDGDAGADDSTDTKAAPAAATNHGHEPTPAAAAGPLAARSERLVADFGELVKALKQQHATRASEGRTLPPAKWAALKSQIDAAQALYAARPDAAVKAKSAAEPGDAPGPDAPDADLDDILTQYHASKSLVRTALFAPPAR